MSRERYEASVARIKRSEIRVYPSADAPHFAPLNAGYEFFHAVEAPLTRLASLDDLSPQAGRGVPCLRPQTRHMATLPPQIMIKFLDSSSPPRGAFRDRHEARGGRRWPMRGD